MRSYVVVSVILLVAITALQVTRLLSGWPVTIAAISIPLWVSGIAAVIAGSLAAWGIRLLRRS